MDLRPWICQFPWQGGLSQADMRTESAATLTRCAPGASSEGDHMPEAVAPISSAAKPVQAGMPTPLADTHHVYANDTVGRTAPLHNRSAPVAMDQVGAYGARRALPLVEPLFMQ